jgi:Tol biopolymer transport system component
LKKETTTLFLEKITVAAATTNIHSKRIRRVLDSQVPARFAFLFAVSAILLLLPSLSVIQINQSAWAGTFPGPNGQIAFASNRDGNFEIYTMSEDGSDQTRLTEEDANDFDPSWSPDGDKIAFVSFRDGSNNMEIYVMDADGSDQTRLTDNDDALDREPSWSPDSDKIAFVSDRDLIGIPPDEIGDANAIYSMDADDGDDVTMLTDNDVPLGSRPTWSPDGEKIAFVSFRDGDNEIYSMNADDGSDVTMLTEHEANHLYPTWSPDGEKIAFSSNREGGENYEIYDMNADDGSDVTRLTEDDEDDREPDWGTNTSPPGDDDGKNKHDDKEKRHGDNAKKKH